MVYPCASFPLPCASENRVFVLAIELWCKSGEKKDLRGSHISAANSTTRVCREHAAQNKVRHGTYAGLVVYFEREVRVERFVEIVHITEGIFHST